MEGGNGANGVSGITHRRALTAEKTSPAVNLQRSRKRFWIASGSSQFLAAKNAKFAKTQSTIAFAAEASNNLLNAESPSAPLDRGCSSR
ncbi:MAG: hypothetical protein IJG38_02585 [Thermoguttaceae bacterium]|nr:hypothetical protein [Thermoguttaceae bacterium]